MSLNGNFSNYGYADYSNLGLYCTWSAVQNISENYSDVTVTVYVRSYNITCNPKTITVNAFGVKGEFTSNNITDKDSTWNNQKLGSITIKVPHNNDGTKSGTISVTYPCNVIIGTKNVASMSATSSSISLDTIPRASSISSLTGSELGSAVSIGITRASSSFTHKVEYSFEGSDWITPVTNAATSASFTPALGLAQYIPNSITGKLTVRVTTFNGSTQIGSPVTKAINLNLPANIVPSFTSLELTRVDNGVPSSWGLYVKGYSKCTAAILGEAGVYGSTIKSYSITGGGSSSSSKSMTTSVLNTAGEYTFTATITDSRGRTATKTAKITVVDYAPPSISVTAKRCTSDGTINSSGTYLKVTCNYNFASVSGKNTVTRSVSCNNVSNTTFSNGTSFILAANCAIGRNYTLTANVQDALGNSATVSIQIPTAHRIFNAKANGLGFAFGGFATKDNTLQSYWPIEVEGSVTASGGFKGNADTATKLQTARTINGTSFDGTKNITTDNWGTARTITIGNKAKSVNGSEDVSWSLNEIGAASATHHHNYDVWCNNWRFYSNGWMGIYDAYNGANRWSWIGHDGTNTLSIYNQKNDYLKLRSNNTEISFGPEGIYPEQTDTRNCGWSTKRWANVFAKNGTIQTSDKNLKTDIKEIDSKYVNMFQLLRPVQYKRNEANSDRIHIGFISQEVKEAMDHVGLTDMDFAGYCRDKKQEQDPNTMVWSDIIDENGNIQYIYSLRYEEFIALNTRMIQECLNRIKKLENSEVV